MKIGCVNKPTVAFEIASSAYVFPELTIKSFEQIPHPTFVGVKMLFSCHSLVLCVADTEAKNL